MSHSKLDILTRKRVVYQNMAISMRIFVQDNLTNSEENKRNFLNTYDLCYLWGSDEVLKIIGEFLDLNMNMDSTPDIDKQSRMKELYSKCLIEMRKDSGHDNTKLTKDSYKFVRFE
jgi:hypothetical protein